MCFEGIVNVTNGLISHPKRITTTTSLNILWNELLLVVLLLCFSGNPAICRQPLIDVFLELGYLGQFRPVTQVPQRADRVIGRCIDPPARRHRGLHVHKPLQRSLDIEDHLTGHHVVSHTHSNLASISILIVRPFPPRSSPVGYQDGPSTGL